jgi:hypothetical protein
LHLIRLRHENPGAIFRILYLRGVRIRRGDELITGLAERPDEGILDLLTSLARLGEVHDRRNGRVGDFDYQLTVLRLGGERGPCLTASSEGWSPDSQSGHETVCYPKIGLVRKPSNPFACSSSTMARPIAIMSATAASIF